MSQYTYGLTRLVGHGHAFTERLRLKDPAAGAGFTYQGDGRYWEMINSISFRMVTTATAGSRALTLTFTDNDGTAMAAVPQSSAVAPSQTAQYTYLWNVVQEQGSTNGPFLNVLPQLFMQPDMSIVVTGANLATGDQISRIRIETQRFVTGDDGYLLGVVDDVLDPLGRLAGYAALRS